MTFHDFFHDLLQFFAIIAASFSCHFQKVSKLHVSFYKGIFWSNSVQQAQTLDSNIKIVWHLHHLMTVVFVLFFFALTSTVTSQPNMALTIKANEKYFPWLKLHDQQLNSMTLISRPEKLDS